MLAGSTQCWWMAQALRSHSRMLTRCLFWRDVVACLSFTNFCDCWLTVGWSRLANGQPRRIYDQKDLCIFCRTYTSVESLTTKTAGPIKRPSSSTITSLHNITGSVASCYKSHRLSTSLRPLNYVVLYTIVIRRFKVRPFFQEQIARQLRTQYTEGVYTNPVTLKSQSER